MRADSFSVSELCAAFSVRQSALSHHLKILTEAGFLARRHEGTATFLPAATARGQTPDALRQQILYQIDEEPMSTDLTSGLEAVQRLREAAICGISSATVAKKSAKQQESITSWEDYSRAHASLAGSRW